MYWKRRLKHNWFFTSSCVARGGGQVFQDVDLSLHSGEFFLQIGFPLTQGSQVILNLFKHLEFSLQGSLISRVTESWQRCDRMAFVDGLGIFIQEVMPGKSKALVVAGLHGNAFFAQVSFLLTAGQVALQRDFDANSD